MRYDNDLVEKDPKTGVRYYRALKYPEIPLSVNDIYIISAFGDRLDQLADQYYDSVEDYWIIAVANTLPGDSLFITPGTQIRIPSDITDVKRRFNELNNKV